MEPLTHASLYEDAEGNALTLCGKKVDELPEDEKVEPQFLSHNCDDCWDRVGR